MHFHVLFSQFHARSVLYIPTEIRIVVQFIISEAIAHKPEPVSAPVFDVKVFRPRVLDQLLKQQRTSRECGCYTAVDAVRLIP